MQSNIQTVPVSKTTLWVGRALSALAVLFLTFDAVIKVLELAPAVTATVELGYPSSAVLGIGLLELVCLAIYVMPRTAILGALLLTGYLGGAVATHVRAGSDQFSVIFPILIGLLLWGGLYLRDDLLRVFVPVRREN